ncbi:MAG: hypothetical protein R3204_15050 [Oceanospirillum sp.]|nr:hypothetical protein [Oceanospirillum sp.]
MSLLLFSVLYFWPATPEQAGAVAVVEMKVHYCCYKVHGGPNPICGPQFRFHPNAGVYLYIGSERMVLQVVNKVEALKLAVPYLLREAKLSCDKVG